MPPSEKKPDRVHSGLGEGVRLYGDVDLGDFLTFQVCFTGPGGTLDPGCECADFNSDNDVDLGDFLAFQLAFTGPIAP